MRTSLSIFLLSLIFLLPPSFAEEAGNTPEATQNLPFYIAGLPSIKDNKDRVYLSAQNEPDFRDFFLASISKLIAERKLVSAAFREAPYAWQFPPNWLEQSKQNAQVFELERDGSLHLKDNNFSSGFPFGDAEKINNDIDNRSRAYKILWNVAYRQALTPMSEYEFELTWVGETGSLRQTRGNIFREFSIKPELADSEGEEKTLMAQFSTDTDLMGRFLFQLDSPPIVSGFSSILWQFRGRKEDLVWVYSPVVGKSRQIFQANWGDPILGGVLSYDDLFVFSGKIQSFKAQVVSDKMLFVPMGADDIYPLEPEKIFLSPAQTSATELSSGLQEQRSDRFETILTARGTFSKNEALSSAARWNFETRQFPQAANWVPTSMFFVPKRVWILELLPTDPYYPSGREVLVVDQESMLPVYKVVYDKKGRLKKTVLAAWNLAKSADGKIVSPMLNFVVGVDASGNRAMTFNTLALRIFNDESGKETKENLKKLLYIVNHGAQQEGAEQTSSQGEQAESVEGIANPAAVTSPHNSESLPNTETFED